MKSVQIDFNKAEPSYGDPEVFLRIADRSSEPINQIRVDSLRDLSEVNSTNDSDSISSVTQFSYTASTSRTTLDESTESPEPDRSARDKFEDHGIQMLPLYPESDYLLFIHPNPSPPPSYGDLPPGGCPRYPIIDDLCGNEQLPSYSPAAFKLGICQRKQEWLSPYDVSPNRSWKSVVIELNSTQLNFYVVSNQLERLLWHQNSKFQEASSARYYDLVSGSPFSSLVTNDSDVELYKMCERNGLFNSNFGDTKGSTTNEALRSARDAPSSTLKKSTYNSKHKLIRSYSLQHAKFGLATDYTKKPNVLRLRLENEQFLIHFSSTKELLDWHLAMSIGKDVSLDLTERESPKYRTVPRRRRNVIPSTLYFSGDVITGGTRQRPESSPKGSKSRLRLGLGGLLSKRSSSTSMASTDESVSSKLSQSLSLSKSVHQSVINSSVSITTSLAKEAVADPTIVETGGIGATSGDEGSNYPSGPPSVLDAPIDDSCAYSRVSDDFHQSEEDYEDDVEGESDTEDSDANIIQSPGCIRSSGRSSIEWPDCKWQPTYKTESKRRFTRNCLKCIRPLGFDDKWLNKPIVKSTSSTPLISYYYECQTEPVAYGNLNPSSAIPITFAKSKPLASDKQAYPSRLNDLAKSTTALNRIPHHNLQEYIVGPHCLIPRGL